MATKKLADMTPEQLEKHKAREKQYEARPEIRARRRIQARAKYAKNAQKYIDRTVAWRKKHKYDQRPNQFLMRMKLKQKVMALYGGCCCNCGELDLAKLTIDHIDGNGAAERKKQRELGQSVYRNILNSGKREDLRCLCASCNIAALIYGADIKNWPAKITCNSSIDELKQFIKRKFPGAFI